MPRNTLDVLAAAVESAAGPPGWLFYIDTDDETGSACLVIRVKSYDSSRTDALIPRSTNHWFTIPITTYNERSWRRWIFECCRRVMNHELGEWLRWGDERPFAPLHGPGEDPYTVHEFRPMVDQLTTQDGSVREPYSAGGKVHEEGEHES